MKFMLLIFGTGQEMSHMSQEEQDAHMQKWFKWDEELDKKGVKVMGHALEATVQKISGKSKDVVEEFQAEEDIERIGGYYVIEAASLDEAVEIAKDCPTFELDGVVEVRPIMVFDQ
jgi:hypothetical protein